MEQRNLFTDPTRGKHGGSLFSEQAFDRLIPRLAKAQADVLRVIQEAGEHGATAKEAAWRLGKGPHAVSPRFLELKRARRIRANGDSRERSAVYVIV